MARAKGIKPMAQNKKAFHDYFVEERIECGMALKGTEVKSMRQGRMNLKESFAVVKDGEVLEYALDGDIYFFMYIDGSKADILVECEHLKAGGRDLRDARLEVSADLGSWDIEARYNGKELTPDDMEAFAPIVQRAAMFF